MVRPRHTDWGHWAQWAKEPAKSMRPAALSVGSVHVGRMGPPSAASQAVCLRCTSWASESAKCSTPGTPLTKGRLSRVCHRLQTQAIDHNTILRATKIQSNSRANEKLEQACPVMAKTFHDLVKE